MVRRRRRGAVAAVLVVAVLSVGCGKSVNSGGSSPSASASPRTTVTVGSVTFAESQIVAEMYAQVLAKAGYGIKKQLSIGQREILQPAMPNQIQVAPEYFGSLLAYLKAGNQSNDPAAEVVFGLIAALGLPQRLRDVDVKPEQLDRIAELSMHDRWIHTNPRRIDGPAMIRELLDAAW